MANKNNSLGDTKAYQATLAVYNRIRAAIETIAYQQPTLVNLTRQVQGFISHLKRTDKDAGGLPFFSKAYTSQKTNREHCLMCILSFIVQEYWDYKESIEESIEEFGEDRLKNLEKQLTLLEAIAADGLSIYRVTGKFPVYRLITKAELDDEEARERVIETLKLEQLKDDEEDIQRAEEEVAATEDHDTVYSEEMLDSIPDDIDEDEELTGDNHEDDGDDKVEGYLVEDEFAARQKAAAEDQEHYRAQDEAGEQYPDLKRPLGDINTTPPMPQG